MKVGDIRSEHNIQSTLRQHLFYFTQLFVRRPLELLLYQNYEFDRIHSTSPHSAVQSPSPSEHPPLTPRSKQVSAVVTPTHSTQPSNQRYYSWGQQANEENWRRATKGDQVTKWWFAPFYYYYLFNFDGQWFDQPTFRSLPSLLGSLGLCVVASKTFGQWSLIHWSGPRPDTTDSNGHAEWEERRLLLAFKKK